MSIKLLASDLDGTLLQNGALTPSNEAYDLIRQLQQKGIVFAASSGRQYHSLRALFAPIADEIAYVCENGALVMYQDKILYSSKMDEQLTNEMLDFLKIHPEYQTVISGARSSYTSDKTPQVAKMMRECYHYAIKEVPDLYNLPEPIIKFSFYKEEGMNEEDFKLIRKHFGNRATVATSGITWIDTMEKNIDKSVGMKALADALNIDMKDCMAVGDHYNDYEMLQKVGHPVAVNNAQPGILEICPQKTPSVEALIKTLL